MDQDMLKSKYAIYTRKSKFTGKGESIGNQFELCRQYIKNNYPDVRDEEILRFEDEGFSGKNVDRPHFKEMMAEAREGTIKAIICYRLDRVTRSILDFSKLIVELEALGITFISATENFDTKTSMGKAMMYIVSIFAQVERETIAERIRDNMYELAKTGRWLGGTTPTGYKSIKIKGSITVDGKVRKMQKLEQIAEEVAIVHKIIAKFLETNSLSMTETFLLQNNIKTKNDKNFSTYAVRMILTNPVYMMADEDAWNYFEEQGVEINGDKSMFDGKNGVMAYNKTQQNTSKSHQARDISEWIIAVGKHKGIISGEKWIKIQMMLEQNKSKSYKKPRSHTALLPGLVYCSHCGSYMRPKMGRGADDKGNRLFNYLCLTKEKSRSIKCDMKNPQGNMLDAMVCEEIKKLPSKDSTLNQLLEKIKRSISQHKSEFDDEIKSNQDKIQKNKKSIKALMSTLASSEGTSAKDYIIKEIDFLHNQNEYLGSENTRLQMMMKPSEIEGGEFDILKNQLLSFGNSFDKMSIEEKRSALRMFVKRVVWDGSNVQLYLFGSEDKDFDAVFSELRAEPLQMGCK